MIDSAHAFDEQALLRAARASLDAQQWEDAERACRQVLEHRPDHPEALGLLGVVLADSQRPDEALQVLTRHLALRPDDRTTLHRLARIGAERGEPAAAAELLIRASTRSLTELAIIQNDLAVMLDRLGRADEALLAADRAVTLAPDFALAHGNRGFLLHARKRYDEAIAAQLSALAHLPADQTDTRIGALHTLVQAAAKVGRLREAEIAICAEIAAGRDDLAIMGQLADCLALAERHADALAVRNDIARRAGIRRSGLETGADVTVLVLAGAGGGLAPLRYLLDPQAFAIRGFTLLSSDQPDAPLGAIGLEALQEADVVFSALADVDHDGGQFDAVAALCEQLDRPVLNHPSLIARTGRHDAETLFAGIPDMVVPTVRYLDRAQLTALPVMPPVLARVPGSHGGENLALLASDTDKADFLAATGAERFLVSPFHNFRSPDGHWRKYRLIFIDGEVFPYHLAIGDNWLVHYWRAEMGRSDWKKAEEERFLDDWRAVFGEQAAGAVQEAARRLGLDYGGVDCALTQDGQLLLFEANACFLVHLDEDEASFPYKHRHVPKIRDAFTRLVRRRAASRRDS